MVYLSLHLILGQVHLFQDLRPLFHYKCLLVGVRWDVTVKLWKWKKEKEKEKKKSIMIFFLNELLLWINYADYQSGET